MSAEIMVQQEQRESNTRLWDFLGKTDPSQTKSFQRGGGFKGTAVKPMWCNLRMTEMFGPAGIGWGSGEPQFQVHPGAEGEMLVYCTVSLWYQERDASTRSTPVYGVGGDKLIVKDKNGLRSSDEAFKAAFTDALGNAMKQIGVAADIHMGRFDDSKYVQEMREEFSGADKDDKKKAVEKLSGFITKTQAQSLRAYIDTRIAGGLDKKAVRRYLDELKLLVIDEIPSDRLDDVRAGLEGL